MFTTCTREQDTNIDYDGLLSQSLEHFECDISSFDEARSISDVMDRYAQLRSSIEMYGLDNSLLSFADVVLPKDGVPGIPSLENFLAMPTISKDAALEGLVSKIKESAVKWLAAIKAHFIKYKKYYIAAFAVAGATVLAIYGYQRGVAGKTLNVTNIPPTAAASIKAKMTRNEEAIAKLKAYREAMNKAASSDPVSKYTAAYNVAEGTTDKSLKTVLKTATVIDFPSMGKVGPDTIATCATTAEEAKKAMRSLNAEVVALQNKIHSMSVTGISSASDRHAIMRAMAEKMSLMKQLATVADTSKSVAAEVSKHYA